MARAGADRGEKLRVVTLVESIRPAGGAERLAAQLALGLDRSRFESTICISRAPAREDVETVAAVSDEAGELGVRVLRLERERKLDLRAWAPLWSLLRAERIDVLHSHMFGSNVWGTTIGRMAGVPVVVAHEHTWSFEGQPLRRFLDRRLIARYADAFLAVSREDRRRMIEVEHIEPSRVLFLPNGIPAPEKPSGRDVRAELGIGRDDPLLGAVGVLRAQKALDVMIRAAGMLAREFPGLKLLLVGYGPDRDVLASLIRDLGLEQTVLLTGVRHDVPDVLEALDVAVSSSDFEGTPLAVLEYMEAAKPIVATRVGGIPDLIEDGVHGLLVEPQDPEGLARAVATLLREPERGAEMGRRARERRRSEFDQQVMISRLEGLYEDLHRAKGARGSRYQPLAEPSRHVRPLSAA